MNQVQVAFSALVGPQLVNQALKLQIMSPLVYKLSSSNPQEVYKLNFSVIPAEPKMIRLDQQAIAFWHSNNFLKFIKKIWTLTLQIIILP